MSKNFKDYFSKYLQICKKKWIKLFSDIPYWMKNKFVEDRQLLAPMAAEEGDQNW